MTTAATAVLASWLVSSALAQGGEVPAAETAAAPAPVAESAPAAAPEPPASDSAAEMSFDPMTGEAIAGPTTETDLFRLEQILDQRVITASGIEEERSLASANVTVISREDIDRRGYRTLAEMLSTVPGLYIIDDLVMPSVSVRGVNGGLRAGTRIVKVMIDGVAVNFRPDLTSFIGAEYIPVEAIERVEIAKGPLSALYGANAFLATVNVITRRPTTGTHVEVAGRSTVLRKVGAGGSGLITYRGEGRELVLSASADRIDRSGVKLQKTFNNIRVDPTLYTRDSAGDLSTPMSAFARFQQSSETWGTLNLEGGIQRLDSNGEFLLNSILTGRNRLSLENDWLALNYNRRWNEVLGTTASISYHRGAPTRDYEIYPTGNYRYYFRPMFNYEAWTGALVLDITPVERLALNVGLDGELDNERILYYQQCFNEPSGSFKSGDCQDFKIGEDRAKRRGLNDVGAFVQAAWSPIASLKGFKLTGNARVDRIQAGPATYPTQVSWRGAVAYAWSPEFITKIVAGRAFQTPSATLLFAFPGSDTDYNVLGNLSQQVAQTEQLRPQSVTSGELNVIARLFGHLAIELGVYYQQLQDKIEFEPIGSDYIAINKGEAQNVGAEVILRYVRSRVNSFVMWNSQRTIGDKGIESAPPELYPNDWGALGVDVDINEAYLNAGAALRWVGPRGSSSGNTRLNNNKPYELPSFYSVDLTLSTQGLKLVGGSETRFLAGVRNLLDQRWSAPGFGGTDIPNLGRMFIVEARQVF